MSTNDRARIREIRARMARTGESYTTAARNVADYAPSDVDNDFDEVGDRHIDDDSGYGPYSYLAHAMDKDD